MASAEMCHSGHKKVNHCLPATTEATPTPSSVYPYSLHDKNINRLLYGKASESSTGWERRLTGLLREKYAGKQMSMYSQNKKTPADPGFQGCIVWSTGNTPWRGNEFISATLAPNRCEASLENRTRRNSGAWQPGKTARRRQWAVNKLALRYTLSRRLYETFACLWESSRKKTQTSSGWFLWIYK